jgi:type II secretory pathway pseudopilin PulG
MYTRRVHIHRGAVRGAFTLVELLSVVFIIGLLIAILVPALNGARNAAKGAKTRALVRAIEAGLELFKQDNESYFRATGGYPPSFSHPRIKGYDGFTAQDAAAGRIPFVGTAGSHPRVYGAHWLPIMLMGLDLQGYVRQQDVPAVLEDKPYEWYSAEPQGYNRLVDRAGSYLDADMVKIMQTDRLPGGSRSANNALFPDWDGASGMRRLPVIVDAFDQAVLYYAANPYGTGRNMLSGEHQPDNNYGTEGGPPYYFHKDNAGFTGRGKDLGWDYYNRARGAGLQTELHYINDSGESLMASEIMLEQNERTFARYILDVNAIRRAGENPTDQTPMKPVRPDSYLLITAGVDAIYGSPDDITNMPKFEDQ